MKLLNTIISTFIIFLFISNISFSQTGKIAGKVTDAKTGEAIPFVNVIVVNTNYGAATDVNGEYSIIGLSPDKYTIKAAALGYNSVTYTNVKVSIDLTTRINFKLSTTILKLGENIVVVAKKPLVTKDLTSSTAIINSNEIKELPVTEMQEVLQLKAGFVGGNVRGGRSGEVVYAIDGVPVTDVYDGSTVVDVNANSIQELQFVSGAFNAEYGRALSGYVNIATKDGTNDFHANITTYIGSYASNHTDIFRNIDNIDATNIRNAELTLSGPLIKNKVFLRTTGRWIYFGGWMYGKRVYTPYNITINKGSSVPLDSRYTLIADSALGKGDGAIVPMNDNEKKYVQAKLTVKVIPKVKITYNMIYDNVHFRDFDLAFSFNPDGNFKKQRLGFTNILGITHTLSNSTFYKLNFTYFKKDFDQRAFDYNPNGLYPNNLLLSQAPTEVPSFLTGGAQLSAFSRSTQTVGIKFDITSQVSQVHMVKAGFEYDKHQLYFNNINYIQEQGLQAPEVSLNPFVHLFIPDLNDPNENLKIDQYTRRPVEFSAYLQDKIELDKMIINVGIRADYFKPDGFTLSDPSDPDIYRPRKPQNLALTLAQRRAKWYIDAPTTWQFSPRLGVAFPLTDRGVVHFSYGHFFQIPNFNLLYTNPEFKFGGGTGNIGLAGNAAMKPEKTISGEVGFQQAFSDDISVDVTAYFRDIRNLAGTRADAITLFGGSASYSQFVNSDFGFVKGVVVSITKRMENHWSATLDYTLQLAKGNASDPQATRNQRVSGEQPEIQLVRLNFDQTHTVNATFAYASDANWGFSFIAKYGSGFPYTPNQSLNVSELLTNSELKPSTFNVDLRAYKNIVIGGVRISFFARVFNLFDRKNQLNVYNDSGTADFTIEEFLRRRSKLPSLVNTLDEYYRNPSFYSEPRRVELGTSIFF